MRPASNGSDEPTDRFVFDLWPDQRPTNPTASRAIATVAAPPIRVQIIVQHPVLGESVLHTITFAEDEKLLGGNLGKTHNFGANDGKNKSLVYPSRAAVVD